jgi:hypothetical protein
MRWVAITCAGALGLGALATADTLQLTAPMTHVLTMIDALPSSEQIDAVHGGREQARENLQAIALGTAIVAGETGVDPGIQIRAVRALPQYCDGLCGTSAAHDTVVELASIPRYRDARRGSDLLVLRAAIETLGVMRVPEDLDLLVPYLGHPSRDIRAAAALALGDLGNPDAIEPLKGRERVEQVGQVSQAIAHALRLLESQSP